MPYFTRVSCFNCSCCACADLLVGRETLVGEAALSATRYTAGDDEGQSSSGTTTGRGEDLER